MLKKIIKFIDEHFQTVEATDIIPKEPGEGDILEPKIELIVTGEIIAPKESFNILLKRYEYEKVG